MKRRIFHYFRYFFHFDTWFALDKFNGSTESLANALGKNDSKVHFSDQLFYNLTENNLWVSTFLRPDESSFTRVQRLSCVVTFFFLAMLGNAMFYQAPGFGEEVLKIGIISFSLTTIISSLKSVAVTTLPVLFVTLVFKHTKEKETKSNVKGISRLIKQKPKTLPFWMRYVAWATIVLTISSSAVILILYSMLWGRAKSNEWLSSFMFSFFESATCVDPLKVRNVELTDNILIFCKKGVLLYNCVNEYSILVSLRYCSWLHCFLSLLKTPTTFDTLSSM